MIVLSVPHTGTRFTCSYLDVLGVNHKQYHTEPAMYEDLLWEEGKAIVPLRDPILQFLSSHFRHDLVSPTKTLEFSIACWELLGELEKKFEIQYLRLDSDMPKELGKIANFCGVDSIKD